MESDECQHKLCAADAMRIWTNELHFSDQLNSRNSNSNVRVLRLILKLVSYLPYFTTLLHTQKEFSY